MPSKYPGYKGYKATPSRGPHFRCQMCRTCDYWANTTQINCTPHPKGPEQVDYCPDYRDSILDVENSMQSNDRTTGQSSTG